MAAPVVKAILLFLLTSVARHRASSGAKLRRSTHGRRCSTSRRCGVAETADPPMGAERAVSAALPVRDKARGDEQISAQTGPGVVWK